MPPRPKPDAEASGRRAAAGPELTGRDRNSGMEKEKVRERERREEEAQLEIESRKYSLSSMFRQLADMVGLKAAVRYMKDLEDAAEGKV